MRHDIRSKLIWGGNSLYMSGRRKPLAGIMPDGKWPRMWRVKYPDGTLSDMVNLSRAKDAALAAVARTQEVRETPPRASRTAIVTEAA
jgi:hypothetical protein